MPKRVSRDWLVESAAIAGKVSPVATVIAEKKQVVISARSKDATVRLTTKSSGDGAWELAVPSDVLHSVAIAQLDDVELTDGVGLGVGAITVKAVAPVDSVRIESATSLFEAWTGPLTDAMNLGLKFAGKEMVYPALRSLSLDGIKGKAMVVATDGYRMVCAAIDGAASAEPVQARRDVMVDRDAGRLVAKDLSKRDGLVQVSETHRDVIFELPEIRWEVPKTQAVEFPDWRRFVPQEEAAGSLTYDRTEMLGMLRMVMASEMPHVAFDLSKSGVTATPIENGKGKASMEAVELAGAIWSPHAKATHRVLMNPVFLATVIEATDAAPLQVWDASKKNRPVMAVGEGRMALAMPLREAAPAAEGGSAQTG